MLKKIPGNGQEDSGKWSTRCQEMFEEVPGNGKKYFRESKFSFIS